MGNNKRNNMEVEPDLIKNFEFIDEKSRLSPTQETAKIIAIYVSIGLIWILFSDRILISLIGDGELFMKMQTYKGWAYVLVTAIIFYGIILRRKRMFQSATDRVLEGYQELSAAYEELTAMESDLSQQYREVNRYAEKLEENRDNLREERDLSNSIIREAPVIILLLSEDLRIKRVNPYCEKVLGYRKEELLGRRLVDTLMSSQGLNYARNEVESFLHGDKSGKQEIEVVTKSGEVLTILWSSNTLHGKDKVVTGMVAIGVDITERSILEERLNLLAFYDSLTGLPNRAMLEKKFKENIDHMDKNKKMAFIYMDIDNFKNINDTLGHTMGDKFIVDISKVILRAVPEPNIVARLSGDEFAILIFDIGKQEEIQERVDEILLKFNQSWILDEQEFFITASLGVAVYPEHGLNVETLMQNADTAMFYVKENGKANSVIYDPSMREKTWQHIFMSSQLRTAISNNEFELYYQPQMDIATGKVCGLEGLIRWFHREKGFISPGEFIPFSEEIGYIADITDWTIEEACKQIEKFRGRGCDQVEVSINLSSKLLNRKGLVDGIRATMDRYGVRPGELGIEITETAVINSFESSIEVLKRLKEIGLTIYLDDFGTGYSSLTYLHKLPIDVLKVDRDFIVDITDSGDEAHILDTIIELAHKMELKVVAEGIETKEQLEYLVNAKCDTVQGYYYSRPLPVEDLEKFLKSLD